MKHLTLALAALALAAAAALQPPPAAAHVVDKEVTCAKHNNDAEWRCLFDSGHPTVTVLVKNTSKETVAFQADEYHSTCGLSSRQLDSSPHVLAAGAQEELKVLCPRKDITCREEFIVSCTVNGVAQKCAELLSVKGQTWKGNKQ